MRVTRVASVVASFDQMTCCSKLPDGQAGLFGSAAAGEEEAEYDLWLGEERCPASEFHSGCRLGWRTGSGHPTLQRHRSDGSHGRHKDAVMPVPSLSSVLDVKHQTLSADSAAIW